MRIKFNKEIEFFFKKYFLPKTYLLKKRIKRSIKKNDEHEIKLVKDFIKTDIQLGEQHYIYIWIS